jgi:hypothetical protein
MAKFNIGNPIPWEPLEPGQIPIPGREVRENIEQATRFPSEPDPEILEELEKIAEGTSGRGGSGGGNRPPTSPSSSDPRPPDPPRPFESTDQLAWYMTFRSSGEWGVFITRRGLLRVATFMVRKHAQPREAYEYARCMLQNHQTAHFLIDRAVLTLELNAALVSGGRPPKYWMNYQYRHRPYSDLEEAICNAYAYRMADDTAKKFLKPFMDRQPHGYSDFFLGMTVPGHNPPSFQQAESQLLSDYQVDKQREGKDRVIGLHSLMQHTDLSKGLKGDLYFTRLGESVKERLPVFLVP